MAGLHPLQRNFTLQGTTLWVLRPCASILRPRTRTSVSMSMEPSSMIVKDVVLVGGGHSHVEVLRSFGMKPMEGVRLTLITKDAHTAYSGMLPGYVSGFYSHEDCHVDLNRLARYADARLILQPATGLDMQKQEVYLEGRPPISYDILSLDVGITPSAQGVPGALKHATPVKPVHNFVERFETLLERVHKEDRDVIVAVVGGGAGGVELSLSVHHRLTKELQDRSAHKVKVKLFSRSHILGHHTSAARRKFLRILQEKGIELHEGVKISAVEDRQLLLDSHQPEPYDECLWCTEAAAPAWLRGTDLTLDASGFVAIEEDLRVQSSPGNVFCVGDMASSVKHPRPKAGVYAVRQGPPLSDNLRRLLSGRTLKPFKPQSTHLSLLTTGNHYAVATKGFLCIEGAWLWGWKDRIDRQWMDKYGKDLAFDSMRGSMGRPGKQGALSMDAEAVAALSAAKMRCGGCGSKVGASVLSRVLGRLQQEGVGREGVLVGLDEGDDAAVVQPPPPGHVTVHTVDFFRSFISDPYVFGRVAAVHALGDCHAMGAAATTALATAVVPYGLEAKTEADLHHMMAGAVDALSEAGCRLVGGHTCEGADMSLGFSVNGEAEESALMRKGGLKPGQALILTKPLGSGVIFAADMRGKAKGSWVSGALQHMQQSSAEAAALLREAGATGCTDVTGFGLVGHLGEMTHASQVTVELDVDSIPLMDGALECATSGVASSLLPSNLKAAALVRNAQEAARLRMWPLLFDPQTSGGLLAGVPEDVAGDTVEHLRSIGYTHASIVGSVQDSLARQTPQAQQQSKATSSTKSLMAKQIIMVGDGLFFAGDVDQ